MYERTVHRVAIVLFMTTLVGMVVASLVLAVDAFLLTFLAILLAVLLVRCVTKLNQWLPWGHMANLMLLLVLLGGTTALGGYFLASAMNRQLEKAGQYLEDSQAQWQEQLQGQPFTREALAQLPIVGEWLAGLNSTTKQRTQPPQQPQQQSSGGGLPPETGASGKVIGVLERVFSTTFGLVTSMAFVFFVGVFLASDPGLYRRGLLKLFVPTWRGRVQGLLDRLGHTLFRWLVGRMMSMVITGVGTWLGLWFLDVPLAATIGLLTAALTFIPNVGAAIALLLAMAMAMTQGASTVAWVVGLYLLLQLIESNVLTPLIQQHQTSIPPALLLAFQLLMGVLTGFLGLMVATPLLAALMVIVDETWVARGERVY